MPRRPRYSSCSHVRPPTLPCPALPAVGQCCCPVRTGRGAQRPAAGSRSSTAPPDLTAQAYDGRRSGSMAWEQVRRPPSQRSSTASWPLPRRHRKESMSGRMRLPILSSCGHALSTSLRRVGAQGVRSRHVRTPDRDPGSGLRTRPPDGHPQPTCLVPPYMHHVLRTCGTARRHKVLSTRPQGGTGVRHRPQGTALC